MLDAQYDSLYSTGKDVLEKKQEKLDKEINIAAIDLTTDSILKADKQKKEEDRLNEKNRTKEIKEKALNILHEYEEQLDPRVFELASEKISNSDSSDTSNTDDSKLVENDEKNITSGNNKKYQGFSAKRIIKKKKEVTED